VANFKVKYASELHLERDWAFSPGHWFKLDWETLETEYPTPECYLVALDARQINLLLHLVSIFPKYYRNWGYSTATLDSAVWDTIQSWISELEAALMSGCDLQDFIDQHKDTNKLLRLHLEMMTGGSVNFGSEDVVPDAWDFSQDGLRPTLLEIKHSLASDMTLQELTDEITASARVDEFKDILEMLTFVKELAPNLGGSLPNVFAIYRSMVETRFMHSMLTLQAYQATSLRGIMGALAPFEEQAADEESTVKSIVDEIDKLPWLATVVAALEPSPAGETAIAVKIAISAKNLLDRAKSVWANWRDTYINQVQNPVPQATIVGVLEAISRKLVWDNWDDQGQYAPGPSVGIAGGAAGSVTVGGSSGECNCAVSCCCGSGRGNGLVQQQTGVNLLSCQYPDGFLDFDDYKIYKCKAANRIFDDFVSTLRGIYESATWFRSRWGDGKAPYPNLFEMDDLIATFLPNVLPNTIEYNLTPSEMSDFRNELTARIDDAFEWGYAGNWASFWWDFYDIFKGCAEYFETNAQIIVDGIYNSVSASEVYNVLDAEMGNAVVDALANYPNAVDASDSSSAAQIIMRKVLINGFLNMLFTQSSFAMNYVSAVTCTGDAGCPQVEAQDIIVNRGSISVDGNLLTMNADELITAGANDRFQCNIDISPAYELEYISAGNFQQPGGTEPIWKAVPDGSPQQNYNSISDLPTDHYISLNVDTADTTGPQSVTLRRIS